MQIRNSFRVGLVALAPLAIFHAAMVANRIAGNAASGAPMTMPDSAFGVLALRVAIDAVLFAAGHLTLRHFGLGSRAAYGIMGGVAAALGYAVAYWAEIWTMSAIAGALVTAAILPTLIGMIAGFLYAQLAGRDTMAMPAAFISAPRNAAPALPVTYDGPVQVRWSLGAGTVAALVPALTLTALAIPLLMTLFVESPSAHSIFLAAPAQMFVTALLVTIAPSALVVIATHAVARSFRRTRGRDYAVIAAVLNCVPACMMIALLSASLLFPLAALVGALMGATYRRLAGIEPLALPEDVLAHDPRALVPEDHPSRRTHAVVING